MKKSVNQVVNTSLVGEGSSRTALTPGAPLARGELSRLADVAGVLGWEALSKTSATQRALSLACKVNVT